MKKKRIIKTSIVVSLIFIFLVLLCLCIYRIINGPFIGIKEGIEISRYVEKYLTKKYGNHNFKVTDIQYDYDMDSFFDFSNPVGYVVGFKCDATSYSGASVTGLYPNQLGVDDWLLKSIYFTNKNGLTNYYELENKIPKEEINKALLDKLKSEFDSNIIEVRSSSPYLDVPDNFGKIPSMNEIETNLDLYWDSYFSFDTIINQDKDEYEDKVINYLNNEFGGSWHIYINKKISSNIDNCFAIACISSDNYNIGKITKNKK